MMRSIITSAFFLYCFAACNSERILPDNSGASGEIIVVMAPVHWAGEPGRAVRALFGQAVKGLPQRESRFTLINYTPSNFPKMIRSHRNIFIGEMGSEFAKAGIGEEFEKWSRDQQVVRIVAPDEQQWLSILQKESNDIIQLYEEKELRRLQKLQAAQRDKDHSLKLKDAMGLNMTIPRDFQIAKEKEDFLHFRRDRVITSKSREGEGFSKMGHQVIDGIFVYSYPYTSDSTFTRNSLMMMRDSILKKYVPGPKEGSYMTTQKAFEQLDLRPDVGETVIDSTFATEMKGLWGMVNAYMGGPFVSVSFVAPDGQNIIAVEGYCFAPQFDKREYLRYVEAIVRSVRLEKT